MALPPASKKRSTGSACQRKRDAQGQPRGRRAAPAVPGHGCWRACTREGDEPPAPGRAGTHAHKGREAREGGEAQTSGEATNTWLRQAPMQASSHSRLDLTADAARKHVTARLDAAEKSTRACGVPLSAGTANPRGG